MKFGEIIRVFRKNNKMTMQEFADKAGLSKGYISMLEKNQHPQSQRRLVPSFETYLKVANAMNMSIDELVALLDDNETVRLNESSSSTPAPELTEREERLVENFHRLSDSQQARLLAYLDGLLDAGRDVKGKDAGGSELTDLLYYDYKPASGMVAEPIAEYNCGRKTQAKKSAGEPVTIAAHHDSEDWTEEELAEIEKFKKYVKTERE